MKKFAACAVLPVLALSLFMTAFADDTVKIDKEPLVLDDSWTDDYLMPNEYHYFPIVLDSVGKLNLKVQSFFEGGTYGRIEFLNNDYEILAQVDSFFVLGTKGEPETVYFEYYLEPGEYYLRVNADAHEENQGDLRIKGTFKEYDVNELEPNADYHEAQELVENENVLGVLTYGDEHDYFTFELKEKTEIEIVINVDEGAAEYALYNEDLESISTQWNPQGFVEKKQLEPGVYYAVMSPTNSSRDAVYNIKYRVAGKDYSETSAEENETEGFQEGVN